MFRNHSNWYLYFVKMESDYRPPPSPLPPPPQKVLENNVNELVPFCFCFWGPTFLLFFVIFVKQCNFVSILLLT